MIRMFKRTEKLIRENEKLKVELRNSEEDYQTLADTNLKLAEEIDRKDKTIRLQGGLIDEYRSTVALLKEMLKKTNAKNEMLRMQLSGVSGWVTIPTSDYIQLKSEKTITIDKKIQECEPELPSAAPSDTKIISDALPLKEKEITIPIPQEQLEGKADVPSEKPTSDKFGELLYNSITAKVQKSYNIRFHKGMIKELTHLLNETVQTTWTTAEIHEFFRTYLAKWYKKKIGNHIRRGYLKYFIVKGTIVEKWHGRKGRTAIFEIHKDNTIPKRKNGRQFFDKLKM